MNKRAKQARDTLLQAAADRAEAQASEDWRLFTKSKPVINDKRKREKKAEAKMKKFEMMKVMADPSSYYETRE